MCTRDWTKRADLSSRVIYAIVTVRGSETLGRSEAVAGVLYGRTGSIRPGPKQDESPEVARKGRYADSSSRLRPLLTPGELPILELSVKISEPEISVMTDGCWAWMLAP